jgi:uncharacterized phage-like protein YoqJ
MDIVHPKLTTVAFTGHRPSNSNIGGYDESTPRIQAIKKRLFDEIDLSVRTGYDRFISGMALGVDVWAAEIVLSLRDDAKYPIKLICAIPFEGQEKAWKQESVTRWKSILDRADGIIYVNDPGYAPWKMQTRNQWMVNNSNLLIAVWDGTDGGTGNCVKYAKSKDANIIQIDPSKL